MSQSQLAFVKKKLSERPRLMDPVKIKLEKGMNLIDLTNLLSDKEITFPTGSEANPDSPPRIEVKEYEKQPVQESPLLSPWRQVEIDWLSKIRTSGYNWMQYVLDSHAGTHVDAPYHFHEQGLRIHEVPLEKLINKAYVLDVRKKKITGRDIIRLKEKIKGKILLLCTGWPHLKVFGTNEYFFDFPTFSPDVGDAILEAGIMSLGVDTPSVDALDSDFPLHNLLLPEEIPLIENLKDLDLLIKREIILFSASPLKIRGGDASPVRAFALIN